MPSAPIRNTASPDLSREKRDDQSFPSSSSQFLARRLRPQKPRGVSQNGLSGGLEEVTFLRLPGVKAITGLSKTSVYVRHDRPHNMLSTLLALLESQSACGLRREYLPAVG